MSNYYFSKSKESVSLMVTSVKVKNLCQMMARVKSKESISLMITSVKVKNPCLMITGVKVKNPFQALAVLGIKY